MKSKLTSKGQITIPIRIRRKLNLKPGQVLEFDESASFLKATKAFDARKMYSVIGCCKDAMPNVTNEQWLTDTRGSVELPAEGHADGD